MSDKFKTILENETIEASAPCRIDMGGTLDIRTFYYPLRHLSPCTFNIAVGLRTRVRLMPYHKDRIKISSKGFKSLEYSIERVPFMHPLGLMFAAGAYFNVKNVHVRIESESPPRSALGGSSAAVVALIAALSKLCQKASAGRPLSRSQMAILAQGLEETVAGVPCGFQDQLAAIFGGVNVWNWPRHINSPLFRKKVVVPIRQHKQFEKHLLAAYSGKPHVSRDINGRWVQQFLKGKFRHLWADIITCTRQFVAAVADRHYTLAGKLMNRETALRQKMTPDVFDKIGIQLARSARTTKCGARFTGAGGGGCVWALGEIENIDRLRSLWEEILSSENEARLLDIKIDSQGLIVN
ncbi:MAG: galactokinase [Desulfobacterales bacterium]|jgi:D-glycero-alpha-D-manno-heptose-7-phosphate kinase